MLQKKMVGPSRKYKNQFKKDGLWHCPCPLHVGDPTTMVSFVTAIREVAKLHLKHNVQLVLGCPRCNKRLESVDKVSPIDTNNTIGYNKRSRQETGLLQGQRTIKSFFGVMPSRPSTAKI